MLQKDAYSKLIRQTLLPTYLTDMPVICQNGLFPRYYWQTKGQASHVRARSFVGRSRRTLRRSVARCHTHGRNVCKITKINPLFSNFKTHVRSLFIDGIPHAAVTINVNLCSVTLKLKTQYLTNKRYSQPNRGSTHINRARNFSNNEANCNSFVRALVSSLPICGGGF